MPSVSLVHATADAETLIVRMARVSNPKNEGNDATAPRLLRYLIRHHHWSPFEMASMAVKIQTERDIAAQILRHRSFSFQEFSTRYAFAQPPTVPALRRQDEGNRQNSIDDLPEATCGALRERIQRHFNEALQLYEDMIDQGVAKECARRILPLSTRTTLYMHGSLRSWIHYLAVRLDQGTQLEHRQIAAACRAIFAAQFPVIAEAAFDDA